MRNRGHVHREQVRPAGDGTPLLELLLSRRGTAPEAEWRDRIASGAVLVDGTPATPGQILRTGQEVTWSRPGWDEPDVPLDWAVLHDDPDLLAVAKPRGLPTLPGGGVFSESTLLHRVRMRYPEAVPAHRLGRDTSGVVLLAPSTRTREPLQAIFRERRVRKFYRALCAGHPAEDAFVVDAPIGEVPYPPTGTLHAATPDGRASLTRVQVLERRGGEAPCALLEVEIETGRPHQIRIHLAFAGHPLAGDPLFGAGGRPIAGGTAVPCDPGYRLHALRVDLPHPRTGVPLTVECAPPPVLRTAQWPIMGAMR